MPTGKERVIAGNTKTGRFISVGPNVYIGERIGPKSRMEQKRFFNRRDKAFEAWREWQREVDAEVFIRPKPERTKPKRPEPTQEKPADVKEVEEVAQQAKPEQRYMYLLAFQGQRSTKGIAVFERMEDAVDMSDALTVALDVNGQEGKYIVEELPIWGNRR